MGAELWDEDLVCVEVDLDTDYWDYWDLAFGVNDSTSWLIILPYGPDPDPISDKLIPFSPASLFAAGLANILFPSPELCWGFSCFCWGYLFYDFLSVSCFSDDFEPSYFLFADEEPEV